MKKIIAYKDYFVDFMDGLSEEEQAKIKRALLLLETEDRIPQHYIKYIRDGVFEFRVSHCGKEFRIFFTYDGSTVVLLLNCYTKKSQKAPKRHIDKAVKLKEEYQNEKKRKHT